MGTKNLLNEPHAIQNDDDSWWYEEPAGINVYHQDLDASGRYVRTINFVIRWDELEAALKRKRS